MSEENTTATAAPETRGQKLRKAWDLIEKLANAKQDQANLATLLSDLGMTEQVATDAKEAAGYVSEAEENNGTPTRRRRRRGKNRPADQVAKEKELAEKHILDKLADGAWHQFSKADNKMAELTSVRSDLLTKGKIEKDPPEGKGNGVKWRLKPKKSR